MPAENASQPSFTDLVERLHQDDPAAVELLVERYGDALRRSIDRAMLVRRLAGAGASRDRDGSEASDIFQTVLLLFLVRLRRHRDGSSDALHFETPGHLVAYLKAIAEHELNRRPSPNPARVAASQTLPPGREPASDEPTPSQAMLARELLERDRAALAEVIRRMSFEERAIWELVRADLSWPEIAQRLGGTSSPEAVRKVFARAVRRIADELRTEGRADE